MMTVPRRVERDLRHRYDELRALSSGGFGDVYAGRDTTHSERDMVAIKRLVSVVDVVKKHNADV
jgi:hypothetical protein